MKVLIVEDEFLIQQSLKKLIERRGFDVVTTSLGHHAIELIQAQNFDRIICDLMLQDISGFDIIEESKKKYTLEEISKIFVIITAYSSPQVLSQATSYRCQILNKPFTNINQAINLMLEVNK